MSYKNRFPTKDADFLLAITVVINYFNVAGNKSRLVITPAAIAALTQATNLLATFNALLTQCQNPNVVTATLIANKNLTRDQIEAALRVVYTDIQISVLTQADRDTLNIPIPSKSHTPAPVPSIAPALEAYEQSHLSITLIARDNINTKSAALPEGVSNIVFEYAFETKDAAGNIIVPSDDDYHLMGISGKAKFTFNYTSDKAERRVYIRAHYLNSRNEAGNWSKPIIIMLI